jgi:template-activating factor I
VFIQTFGSNPFFSNRVLKKEFAFVEPENRKAEKADRDGFKLSMLDFDWERDVKPKVRPGWVEILSHGCE